MKDTATALGGTSITIASHVFGQITPNASLANISQCVTIAVGLATFAYMCVKTFHLIGQKKMRDRVNDMVEDEAMRKRLGEMIDAPKGT